jgi:heat shock protein HslJ
MLRMAVCLLALAGLACASPEPPASPPKLEGTRWSLVLLGGTAVPAPASPEREPFVVFGPEGNRLVGSGGCNRFAGSYEQKGAELSFGPIAATRMACADGMATEDAFLAALSATAKWRIAGERLELADAEDKAVATLEARR